VHGAGILEMNDKANHDDDKVGKIKKLHRTRVKLFIIVDFPIFSSFLNKIE
jgi:hypothetical protein